jgi:hypothetical protein
VTRQVIILNCPPNSGKDTVADYIQETYGCDHLRFKTYLYEITAKLFVMELEELIEICTRRETKEDPVFDQLRIPLWKYTWAISKNILTDENRISTSSNSDLTVNLTPREALKYVSEAIVKPYLGKDYFGKALANEITSDLSVVSDGGFREEILPVCEELGAENVFLVQWTRAGTSFDNDTREYIDPPEGVNLLETTNENTISNLVSEVMSWRNSINEHRP